jgi:hypothetical protein
MTMMLVEMQARMTVRSVPDHRLTPARIAIHGTPHPPLSASTPAGSSCYWILESRP